MTFRTITHDAEETHALGSTAGRARCAAGDVVVLAGELGTGKTVLAKGIAVALGVDEPVVSPTFTIVREYDAPHAARARRRVPPRPLQELHDLGFDELVGGEAVTVVEWGDRVSAAAPESSGSGVLLEPGDGDDDRVVSVDAAGLTWARASRRAVACAAGDVGG